jgi:maltose O-acetyltransferase
MIQKTDVAVRRLGRRLRFRYGGIESINSRLLLAGRVEHVLAEFGANIGVSVVIHGPLVVHNAARDYTNLTVGDGTHVGRLVTLDLADAIVLEPQATVSMGSTILTHVDVGDRPLARRLPREVMPTRIGHGSYLGANVTVLPGCHVGSEAVVGAGAVVTRAIPDGAVMAGVPARALERAPG